jgi:hypothetical protein
MYSSPNIDRGRIMRWAGHEASIDAQEIYTVLCREVCMTKIMGSRLDKWNYWCSFIITHKE